jgi:hypothetical protein
MQLALYAPTSASSGRYLSGGLFTRKSDERIWYYIADEGEQIQLGVSGAENIVVTGPQIMSAILDDFAILTILPDEARFQILAAQWRRERGVTSSPVQMAMCPSYQRIMTMSDRALPLILRQLESEGDDPDHWFWALRYITDADPVPPEDRGNMKRMAAAWLDWGRRHGIAW